MLWPYGSHCNDDTTDLEIDKENKGDEKTTKWEYIKKVGRRRLQCASSNTDGTVCHLSLPDSEELHN